MATFVNPRHWDVRSKLRQITPPAITIRQKLADSEITCVSTINFMTQLQFHLDFRALKIPTGTNLESGPRYAKIW